MAETVANVGLRCLPTANAVVSAKQATNTRPQRLLLINLAAVLNAGRTSPEYDGWAAIKLRKMSDRQNEQQRPFRVLVSHEFIDGQRRVQVSSWKLLHGSGSRSPGRHVHSMSLTLIFAHDLREAGHL